MKVLCSETTGENHFRVIDTGSGVKAEWTKHGTKVFDSIEELKEAGVLNRHELQLLEYGVGKS